MIKRRKTKVIQIGNRKIGGTHPILIQSMTNTVTSDVAATVRQINVLEKAGCELIRVAVPNMRSAKALASIKKNINLPLIADIHFSPLLAYEAIKQGVDKIRINPGNYPKTELEELVKLAKKNRIPIRIGINSGSLESDLLDKYKGVTVEAMVESALRNIKLIEGFNFFDLVISVKSPDTMKTIKAYQILSEKISYPLHLGITEAGTILSGTIKSSIGIGSLLLKGIGDTIRVSLTEHPKEEIKIAKEILQAIGLRQFGRQIISCPTCGRTEINLIKLAKEVAARTAHIQKPIKIAVMGCVVNGPGEAKEADIGIAGGKNCGIIFRHGKRLKVVKESEIVDALMEEINKVI